MRNIGSYCHVLGGVGESYEASLRSSMLGWSADDGKGPEHWLGKIAGTVRIQCAIFSLVQVRVRAYLYRGKKRSLMIPAFVRKQSSPALSK